MRTLITPIIALSAAASAMAQYTGDLYWKPGGQWHFYDQTQNYAYESGGEYINLGSDADVNWSEVNAIFDGSAGLGDGGNVVNMPDGKDVVFKNFTIQNFAPASGRGDFYLRNESDAIAQNSFRVIETFKIASDFNGAPQGFDRSLLRTDARFGSLVIENTQYDSTMVNFGTGLNGRQFKGFNSVTVDNGMSIKGGVSFNTNLGDIAANSATAASPALNVAGVVDMQSFDGKNPTWTVWFYAGDIRTDDTVNSYYSLGGLNGTGSFMLNTQHAYTNKDPRLTVTFTNTGVSEYKGVWASEGNSSLHIVMNGGENGVQILRTENYVDGSYSYGYKGSITVNSGTLKMYATQPLENTSSSYQGRNLFLNGGYFGAVAQIAPTGGEGDIGTVELTDFTWNGGSLLVNFDYDTGNVSQLMVSGEILLGAADNTYRVYVTGDGLGEGDSIYDFLMWDDSANDATMQAAIDAGSFKIFVNGVEWEANFSISGGALSAELVQVPEPAAVAAILGALALGLAMYRRRK